MGSLGIVGYRAVAVIAVSVAGSAMIYAEARALNLLALGEESALQLGSRPSASSGSSSWARRSSPA
jgi:ABC-type Fe3+-siderophore transport system permease subunit